MIKLLSNCVYGKLNFCQFRVFFSCQISLLFDVTLNSVCDCIDPFGQCQIDMDVQLETGIDTHQVSLFFIKYKQHNIWLANRAYTQLHAAIS